jgi:hypothetical protein
VTGIVSKMSYELEIQKEMQTETMCRNDMRPGVFMVVREPCADRKGLSQPELPCSAALATPPGQHLDKHVDGRLAREVYPTVDVELGAFKDLPESCHILGQNLLPGPTPG